MVNNVTVKENKFYMGFDSKLRKVITIDASTNKVTYQKYDRFMQPTGKSITATKRKFDEWVMKEYIEPSKDVNRHDHIQSYLKKGFILLGTTSNGMDVAYWKDDRNEVKKYWIMYFINNIAVSPIPIEIPEEVLKMLCNIVV